MTAFPQVGEVFDNQFDLKAVVASDENSTTFKALQLDCKRNVSLKILHLDVATSYTYRQRILREAKALCRSRHRNVLRIFRIAVSEADIPYIVMELIEGKTVREKMDEEGRFSVPATLSVIARCADALNQMHRNGIVHRDLKPESIIVYGDPEMGKVKLSDFGLASVISMRNQSLTMTGVIIGSMHYMSPEQCMGQAATTESDIYALTACLYEMLTARKPFEASNEMELMAGHINAPEPQIEEHELVPFDTRINQIIARGMAKRPDKRYGAMNELYHDITILQSSWGQEAR